MYPWLTYENITLWLCQQFATEQGHNSLFSHENMVIFHGYVSLPEGHMNNIDILEAW